MDRTLPRQLTVLLFAISGACDLVCELAWTRALGLVFGVAAFAVSMVLAVFMLGMATGGIVADRLLKRVPAPPRLFTRIHLALCLATIGTLPLIAAARGLYLGASGFLPAWALDTVLFLLSGLVLLVPTILMGTTFPVACALLGRSGSDGGAGRNVAVLYAAGTLGGVVGCVAAAFVVLPAAGTRGTLAIAALVDGLIALVAFVGAQSGSPTARP
jgi:spermidine synthase